MFELKTGDVTNYVAFRVGGDLKVPVRVIRTRVINGCHRAYVTPVNPEDKITHTSFERRDDCYQNVSKYNSQAYLKTDEQIRLNKLRRQVEVRLQTIYRAPMRYFSVETLEKILPHIEEILRIIEKKE